MGKKKKEIPMFAMAPQDFKYVVEAPSSNNFILFGSGPIVLFVRIDTTENPRLPFYDSLTPFPCFGRMYE